MYTNIRLDLPIDFETSDKVSDVFKNYASTHTGFRFLLAKETGTQTGKPHYQGWCCHTEERTAIREYVYKSFPDLKGGKRSVIKTNNIVNEYRYIINNKTKPGFTYDTCVTNYTLEEYDEIVGTIKDLPPFVPKDEYFAKKPKNKSWWHDTVDILDKKCVYNDIILYSTIPTVFFEQPLPKRVSKTILKENLDGMIMELERRHLGNTRLHTSYMESVMCDPIFKYDKEEFELFKKII